MRVFFMLTALTTFLSFLNSQTGSVIMGKQWQNGVMIVSSDGGCDGGCAPMFCDPISTGNGTNTVSIYTLTVPAGSFMTLNIYTNICSNTNPPSHGLDSGEDFFVNDIQVVDGFGNANVNYSGCFHNNGTSPINVEFRFNANRRDETVTAEWEFFANNPGGNCITATPLPIKLKSFDLQAMKTSTLLTFTTASETNNDYFTIERSSEGISYEALGEIKGAGNSNELLTYTFIDEKPMQGINYYRIKQTDYDGKYSYTEIKSVRHFAKGSLSISPRTTEGRLQVMTEVDDYTLEVYNASGQLVKSFKSLSAEQSVSIDELPSGLYFVRIQHDSEIAAVKITKI